MPKAKKSAKRKKFDYGRDRKKLKRKLLKKHNPRIENAHVRNAWDSSKSTARNFEDMGLSLDPNRALPVKGRTLLGEDAGTTAPASVVTKPYVLNQLEEEASRPEKSSKTLSADLIEYVQHMIREHGDDYKAMARDEKNYYQDTPKQIRRKIDKYQRFYPEQHGAFIESLAVPRPTVQ